MRGFITLIYTADIWNNSRMVIRTCAFVYIQNLSRGIKDTPAILNHFFASSLKTVPKSTKNT